VTVFTRATADACTREQQQRVRTIEGMTEHHRAQS
jgi:hypothetical protein